MRVHKYKAIAAKCQACGASHPSKKEARRCGELHLMQRGGAIRDLRTQAAFPLFGMGGLPLMSQGRAGGSHKRQLRMTWDFAYTDERGAVVEDSKGMALTDFQLRLSVFQSCYPDIVTVVS